MPLITVSYWYILIGKYSVTYNKSRKFIKQSGVSQGSNLGPLFSLLLLNYLETVITWQKQLFTDDLTFFNVAETY